MITFVLIFALFDSAQFGFATKPRLRKVQSANSQVVMTATSTQESEPVYYPIDQSDKFTPCPIDAKRRGLHCPE